jgi:hypothetical protein
MKNAYDNFELLKSIIKDEIKSGYCVDDFQHMVRAAIRAVIADGHMFVDYLQCRDEIENDLTMEYDEDEWEQLLIKAMGDEKDESLEFASGSNNESLFKKLGFKPKQINFSEQVEEAITKILNGEIS